MLKFRVTSIRLGIALAVMALAPVAIAQSEPPAPPDHPRGMGMMSLMMGGIGEGQTVKGIPVSAELNVTRDTTLADGNRIHTDTQTMIYRDSEGRVRREVEFALNTPMTGAAKRMIIIITDPVAGVRYTLNPQDKTARQIPLRMRDRGAPGAETTPDRRQSPDWKSEQLGNKALAGLQTQGTRVTRTIPAGEIGNQNPIEVITERWYSPDLQLPILTTHTDPMMGTVTSQLNNINRSEPSASLFQVPSDYKLEKGRRAQP